MRPPSRTAHLTPVVAGILATAALVRLWGIDFGLPVLQARPDEVEIVSVSLRMLDGHLNPRFFNYPSGFMYALAAVLSLTFVAGAPLGLTPSTLGAFHAALVADPTPAILTARLLAAACGVGTVYLTYRLGRESYGVRVGVSAALILALTYLHGRDSHFGVTDVPLTLLLTASVLFILRAHRHGRLRDYGWAGALAGLAAATKYNGLILVAPLALLLAFGGPPTTRGWRHMGRRVLVVALCATTAAIAASPFALIDHQTFTRDFLFEMRHLREGHGRVDLGRGWLYHATFTLPVGVGWPVLGAALAGLLLAVRRHPLTAALTFAFPVCYYISAGSGRTVFVRYMVPMTPFLALAAGVCINAVTARLMAPRSIRWGGSLVPVLAASLLIVAPSAWRLWEFDTFITRTDSRLMASSWLAPRVEPGVHIYQSGARYGQLPVATAHLAVYYDEAIGYFRSPTGHVVEELPEWMVIQRAPLRYYNHVPDDVIVLASRCYALQYVVSGVGPQAGGHQFDQQDAYYVPYVPLAGARRSKRPGPDIEVYRRWPDRCPAALPMPADW